MPAHATDLPLIRHSERVDFKRCQKKWYWRWRKGLTPKVKTYGALDLGTWMHLALQWRYTAPGGLAKQSGLADWFDIASSDALREARDNLVPEYQHEKATELAQLGKAMANAYDAKYGRDPDVNVIAAEIPLEFPISDSSGKVIAIHKLKPDLVYADSIGDVWLMEHKTAASIRLEHLVIDDQARPYVAMAEPALRKAGIIGRSQQFKGIMYNFLRKAVPDQRPTNEKGQYLNKNGSISKSQPPPYFMRHPVTLTVASRKIALLRLRAEARTLTERTQQLRSKELTADDIPITPHSSCPKFCDFFAMCVVAEQGGNVTDMEKNLYVRRNPYTYDEETTDIPPSFEMG